MTPEELTAIRERCEKATPGPWEWFVDNDGYGLTKVVGKDMRIDMIGDSAQTEINAEFIAHAPTDIAYLLSLVDKQREEIEGLRNRFAHFHEASYINDRLQRQCACCGLDLADPIHLRKGGLA